MVGFGDGFAGFLEGEEAACDEPGEGDAGCDVELLDCPSEVLGVEGNADLTDLFEEVGDGSISRSSAVKVLISERALRKASLKW